jgi:hypothetical protein
LFRRNDLVTLRWNATGTLGQDESYRVRVRNLSSGVVYTVDVRENVFIIPTDWQERDGERHDYEWQVSVIKNDNPDSPIFETGTRIFTWEAVNEGDS